LRDITCGTTRGPCVCTGNDMETAHKELGAPEADFNALVHGLIKTLNKFHVPAKQQGQLVGILGPLKPQIVNRYIASPSSASRAATVTRLDGAKSTVGAVRPYLLLASGDVDAIAEGAPISDAEV